MKLTTLIKKNTLHKVSDETKINQDVLENLAQNCFDSLSETKALGFISILERDYHVELSELKKDIIMHFSQKTSA